MRVALAAEGTRGDIHPMLDLGTSLLAHGHQVVVCAPPDFREEAQRRGLTFRPVGEPVRPFMRQHAGDLVSGGRRAFTAAAAWLRSTLEHQFEALPDAIRDVDRVVGAGVQIAGPSAAECHGIPYRYLLYCPVLLPSAQYPPPVLPVASLPRPLNRLAWWAQRRVLRRLLRGPLNERRSALGLAPVADPYRYLLGDEPLLAADPLLAPLPADCPVSARSIGCLHASRPAALPTKLETFLEQGEPPLFFGFGSMPDPAPLETTRLLLDAIERSGRRALIQEGWAELGRVALPDTVRVIGPCAHTSLFPRCAAIVHHGGAGTTTQAARSGVPQLVVAHIADQFYWGRRVSELGLGPPALRRSKLSAALLAARLGELVENETLRERAREIGARLDASRPPDRDPAPLL